MANKEKKYPDNAKGKFYVDNECIRCDACVLAADGNFAMNDDQGHAFVKKQPENKFEEDACREAMEGCPVEAIGNDGDNS